MRVHGEGSRPVECVRSINQPTGRLINFLRICGGTRVNEGSRGAIRWREFGFAHGASRLRASASARSRSRCPATR
ncbi:hypothetical protein GD416_28975 [Burkholderia sp. BE24]|nr:hypothetical protein [Burkholderia sp. BE24]